jgi:hypothetical protein
MDLVVVKRVDGAADSLTEERFELGTEFLCLCAESGKERKLNDDLMAPLRTEAAKVAKRLAKRQKK